MPRTSWKLPAFARTFTDYIYRVDYIAICSREQDFHPTLKKCLEIISPLDVKEVMRMVTPHSNENCNGRCHRLETKRLTTRPLVVMWIRKGIDVSVVSHEAWHAARWVLAGRGLDLSPDASEEAVAYYLQWIIRSALGIK